MLASGQRLVEDCENLAMPRKLSSLLLETEILLMTLPRGALHFKSNFRYSACAFLFNIFRYYEDNWEIQNLRVLKRMKLENYTMRISPSLRFHTISISWTSHADCAKFIEMFLRVPFKSSQYQRGYCLSHNNERDFDAII